MVEVHHPVSNDMYQRMNSRTQIYDYALEASCPDFTAHRVHLTVPLGSKLGSALAKRKIFCRCFPPLPLECSSCWDPQSPMTDVATKRKVVSSIGALCDRVSLTPGKQLYCQSQLKKKHVALLPQLENKNSLRTAGVGQILQVRVGIRQNCSWHFKQSWRVTDNFVTIAHALIQCEL